MTDALISAARKHDDPIMFLERHLPLVSGEARRSYLAAELAVLKIKRRIATRQRALEVKRAHTRKARREGRKNDKADRASWASRNREYQRERLKAWALRRDGVISLEEYKQRRAEAYARTHQKYADEVRGSSSLAS